MNTDEMKRIAEIVYPGEQWFVSDMLMVSPGGGLAILKLDAPDPAEPNTKTYTEFAPSLTGEDWQKAQALDVIVAALSLPGALALHKFETTKGTYFQFIRNRDPGLTWEDPLQAACAALLQEGR